MTPRAPRPSQAISATLRRLAVLALAWAVSSPTAAAAAQSSPKNLFDRASTIETKLRSDLAGTSPGSVTLPRFRAAIEAYRVVVWTYPTSGYNDNALWQAAHLALDAFERFGQARDRRTAVTYLDMLVSQYPASGYVRRAKATLKTLTVAADTVTDAPPARVEPAAAPGATPSPSVTPATGGVVVLNQVQRFAAADATTIVVELTGLITYREERLHRPERVYFDLLGTRPADSVKDAILSYESGLVRQVRVGRHPHTVTRVVLDVEGVTRHTAQLLTDPVRLVITCWGQGPTAPLPSSEITRPLLPSQPHAPPTLPPVTLMPAPPISSAADTTRDPAAGPHTTAGTASNLASGEQSPAEPVADAPAPRAVAPVPSSRPEPSPITSAPVAPPVTPPAAPSSNTVGGYSLARQLGLGASRIVIDAGHGGHDPGALVGNTTEATIVLDIALRLERLLLKQAGIEVVLTRRTDVFLPLPERTEIANREGADLFVSIHVNASERPTARGVETYLLDFASTPEAEAVAARENASSLMTMSSLNELVRRITLTSKADESRDLARRVQASLVRRLRSQNPSVRDLGVKRAPFVVLIGAAMPSVLVEVAFLTHRQERRLLSTPAYRQRIAESLAEGIRRYQTDLKKASPVVLQRTLPPLSGTSHEPGGNPLQ